MNKLPLGFDAQADATSDPLVQLLLAEDAEDEGDAVESINTARRESVLVINTLEQSGETLRTRVTNTAPGPCTIYRFK